MAATIYETINVDLGRDMTYHKPFVRGYNAEAARSAEEKLAVLWKNEVNSNATKKAAPQWGEAYRAVYSTLRANGGYMATREVAETIGASSQTALNCLKRLQSAGCAKSKRIPVNGTMGYVWAVGEKNLDATAMDRTKRGVSKRAMAEILAAAKGLGGVVTVSDVEREAPYKMQTVREALLKAADENKCSAWLEVCQGGKKIWNFSFD